MILDQAQKVEGTQNANDLLLVGHRQMMDLVIPHHARCDVHVRVQRDRVDFRGHDVTDGRPVGYVLDHVRGRDDAPGPRSRRDPAQGDRSEAETHRAVPDLTRPAPEADSIEPAFFRIRYSLR